jgi:hypothetical protein
MHKIEFGQSYLNDLLIMIPMKFILNCILFSMNFGILKELSGTSIQEWIKNE